MLVRGEISFWKHDANEELKACQLQHCLYCSNGGISDDERIRLKGEFIDEDREFISMTTKSDTKQQSRKRDKHRNVMKEHQSIEQIVFSENEHDAPNRVIVMDDLMNEAFNSRDKEVNSMMNLLMTKLSHHNNISVLLVCHELYPKGTNSVLLREQLTGMHFHAMANAQKAKNYVCNYLADEDKKC